METNLFPCTLKDVLLVEWRCRTLTWKWIFCVCSGATEDLYCVSCSLRNNKICVVWQNEKEDRLCLVSMWGKRLIGFVQLLTHCLHLRCGNYVCKFLKRLGIVCVGQFGWILAGDGWWGCWMTFVSFVNLIKSELFKHFLPCVLSQCANCQSLWYYLAEWGGIIECFFMLYIL